MQDYQQGFVYLNRNQSQDNSLNLDHHLNNLTNQASTNGQLANAGSTVADEGVDVLSLMGFKL